ncbi:PcfK-like family protein [Flavobacterium pectinovorum]|uniref:PcfK-like family protein n=1 Tax=Flavobacterium pectinovorum TaxID=29533 RepID=UPI001FACC234|nr:Cas9 inhibitor AcrIIA9 family protein [Flavobacterium pectinovorum]MCI9845955.1 PcfK-like family protein [Flavobacterium pectinovorum]
MKPSENFKTAIENYLNTTAQGDTVFARSLAKETKNIESCFNYIFGEVKKTGLCAFDNQEIFDMAVKYYTDDSIGIPAPVACRAVVQQTAKADLFCQPEIATFSSKNETIPQVKQEVKTVQTALTLFDL